MKRLLIFALVGAVCSLAGFAAGQDEAASTKPITLNFYHYASQTHVLYINPLKEAFEKEHPNITIESVEVAKGGYEALSQKVLLGLAAGDPADVAQMGYSYLRTMVDSGNAVSLDKFISSDSTFDKGGLYPAMAQLGQADGQQYLIPIGTSTPMMFINTELLGKLGLDIPTTWDAAKENAKVLKANGNLGILWGWSVTGNWIFQAMIENAGGKINKDGGTVPTFNSEPGLKTLSYLADLASSELMPVTDDLIATFIAGNLGMFVGSSFQRVNIPRQTNFEVRMAPMPTPDGSAPVVPAGGNGAMMFAKDKDRQDAAWKLIRFIAGEEASRIVATNSGYTPANQEMIKTLKEENASDANFQVTLDQAAQVIPWHSWPGQNSSKIAKVLRDMQEAVLLGRIGPKQALADAEAEVNALLK